MSDREVISTLFLSPMLHLGGEELSTLTLVRELAGRGHRVSFIGGRGPLWEELQVTGTRMVDAGASQRNVAAIRAQAAIIRRVVVEEAVDIVHSQSVVPTLAAAWALRRPPSRNIPLIFHDRSIHWYSYPVVARLFDRLTACVIANSEFERRRLIRHGLSEHRCVRIYNAVNLEAPADLRPSPGVRAALGLPEGASVIGTVGRLVKEKALPVLLRAFARVVARRPATVLLVVGDGPLREALTAEAAALGIAARVVFAGARRDLARIYPLIDVFVLSSIFESFGNVALEAAMFGKPVVGTRVGGLTEAVVEGGTGLLVPPRDPDGLAGALLRLLRDPASAHAMGQAGRARVLRDFTAGRVADEVERLYEGLLGRGRRLPASTAISAC